MHPPEVAFGKDDEKPVKRFDVTEDDESIDRILTLLDLQHLNKDEIMQIDIHHKLTNLTSVSWITHFVNATLYVGLPQGSLPDGSKDAFVGLLEYAEEVLMCKQAIVFFPKDRNDRANLVRTFMFMGFNIVASDNPMLYKPIETNVYMVYTI